MQRLSEKNWAPVKLKEQFTLQRGRENNMSALGSGRTPLISAKANNNGVKGFVSSSKKVVGNCITLNNDGDGGAGLAYYQPAAMALDAHVTALTPKAELNREKLLFISTCLSGLHDFFGHGLSISNPRANNIETMLPIDDSGNPDFAYMESYASCTRKVMLRRYREFAGQQLSQLEYKMVPSLNEKEWAPFSIVGLFDVIVPGRGKGLNHLFKMRKGGVNYVGATNRNNGVLCYVREDDSSRPMILDGNCIGFIKNGDGSAGFAIYKAEQFISTSDVLYGYADWLNVFTGLFFVAAQDKIEHKYSHGYKRNKEHLAGDKVMLPVADSGSPDYEYMEQYAKNMMLRKYEQYLDFRKKAM